MTLYPSHASLPLKDILLLLMGDSLEIYLKGMALNYRKLEQAAFELMVKK